MVLLIHKQLFSASKKYIYFMNNLNPTNYMFLFRLIYHLRNERINSDIYTRQAKGFEKEFKINKFVQLFENFLSTNRTINHTVEKSLTDTPENSSLHPDETVDETISNQRQNMKEIYNKKHRKSLSLIKIQMRHLNSHS